MTSSLQSWESSALPDGFALDLLEKELALEHSPSLALLQEVVAMYSLAIEHYEFIKDPLHFSFQERMHRLLARPDMRRLFEPPQRRFQRSQTVQLGRSSLAETPASPASNVQRFLERNESTSNKVLSQARNDMRTQDYDLQRRLAVRKQKHRNSLTSQSFLEDSFSTTEGSPKNIDAFQQQIEAVLEEIYAKKAEKVAAITVKYEVQMNELGEDSLAKAVKAQMQRSMQCEIDQVSAELESFRKEKLQQIKSAHFN